MNLNYIDIAFIAVVVLAAIIGYCKGLLISVVNLIRFSLGIFLCFYFSQNLPQPIFDIYFKQRCLDTINEKIVTSGNIDETIKNLNDFIQSLPEFIKNLFDFKALNISSADIANSVLTNVFEPAVISVLKVIIFVIIFILFFAATGFIIYYFQKNSKRKDEKRGHKTVLKRSDKLLGMLFGLFKSFIIVLAIDAVLMYILNLRDGTARPSAFFTEVENSVIANYLNTINPFNKI